VSGLILLAALGVAAWFVGDSLAAREQALRRIRAACAELNVQLLDDTVAVASLAPARGGGRLCLRRLFRFEVSTRGDDRCAGVIALRGRSAEYLRLELPAGPVILGPAAGAPGRVH